MNIDDAIAALSRGCCSREAAAESGCEKCVQKYAALDWIVAAFEATCAGHADGAVTRGDIVFARGYRRGRAEAEASIDRLRKIEALARANWRATACHDQVIMDEPECGECAGCELRAALEAKT